MPFLWEQIVDLTYKPSFDVVRVEEAVSTLSFMLHSIYLFSHNLYHQFPFTEQYSASVHLHCKDIELSIHFFLLYLFCRLVYLSGTSMIYKRNMELL